LFYIFLVNWITQNLFKPIALLMPFSAFKINNLPAAPLGFPVTLAFFVLLLTGWTGMDAVAGERVFDRGDRNIGRGERPPVDFAGLAPSAYEAGRIYVRFTPPAEKSLGASGLGRDKNGLMVTGLHGFDSLGQKYGMADGWAFLDALYAASPASVQYRERHREWGFHLWYEFMVPAKTDILSLVRELGELEEVEAVEPVFRIRQIEPVDFELLDINELPGKPTGDAGKLSAWLPNDPFFPNHQWHLNNTGQTVGGVAGTPGADIGAPLAWGISRGSPAVIVAVIDDGVHVAHPDLAANMWAGVGYNFVDGNETIVPKGSHGTHVAGTVAAVTNNGAGVAGIAGGSGSGNGARIMTCQIFTESGSGNAHLAMIYAADNGAAISQNSWGYDQPNVYNQSLLDAIDYFNANGGGAALSGGITVFAAGNDNTEENWYPAFYSGAIAVAATDNHDVKSGYSNFGSWIDISAPGNWIASTSGASGYGSMSGTSAACPSVSGVAALLASYAPGSSASQVVSVILNNTDNHYPVNPGYSGKLGSGRLSAARALSQLSGSPLPETVLNPSSFAATPVSSTRIDLSWVRNNAGHSVMLAASATGSFGSPSDGNSYGVGSSLPGGGTVIYRGSANGYSHTGLETGTTYYYRAWSFSAGNTYSSGISTQTSTGQPDSYFIVASAGANGIISPSGSIAVSHGGSQTFTIVPDEYFNISAVLVNGVNVGAVSSYTFSNVTANQSISAEFAGESFLIHAIAGPNGRISPSGHVAVTRGSSMTFNMVADAGYIIGDVLVNGASVGNPSSYTFENVTAHQTISVGFTPVTFTIAATAGEHGQILPEGEIIVNQGSNKSFEIIPDTGYHIEDVVVNGESVGAVGEYTFTNVRADHSISASFERTYFTIVSSSGPNGMISPSGELSVPYGEEITFYFSPEPGYEVSLVEVDGEAIGQADAYTFSKVEANHTISVAFVPVVYTITATAGEGGIILPEGEIAVTVEDIAEFEIISSEGYLIDEVLVNGESHGPVGFYSFSGVTADHAIHAVFKAITYPVTFRVDMQFAENYDPDTDMIYVSGSMFDWAEPGSLQEVQRMVPAKDSMVLVLEMELPAGSYEYKYFLNTGTEGEEWPGEPYRRIDVPEIRITSDFFGYMTDPTAVLSSDGSHWLKVYPNPASGFLFVESTGPMNHIHLLDITGRTLIWKQPLLQRDHLDIRDLPGGVYFIRVTGPGRIHTGTVVISR
jgi:subtilisin family serine protease/predicted ester cyclase